MRSPQFSDDSVFNALLCLPDDEIVEKLRVMDIAQIIEFSLISGRCKNLIKSIKIQGTNVIVHIKSEVVVFLEFGELKCDLNFGDIKSTSAPLEVIMSFHTGSNVIKKTIQKDQFGMNDWMKHLYTTFNILETDSITFDATSLEYDPVDIKKYFGVPSSLIIKDTENYDHDQFVLQAFLPVDSLDIASDMFEDSRVPREVLIQNFKTLAILEGFLTLDDLLMVNSKSIEIQFVQMSSKDINRFIKLWHLGANPRMEYLHFWYEHDEVHDKENILKGVKYTKIPEDVGRWFRLIKPKKHLNILVAGGIEVVRKDGVRATIQFDFARGWLEMVVWFDHCIGCKEPTGDSE